MSWREVFPDESPEKRHLRQGLGIDQLLQKREVWRLNASINVEIYPVSREAPNILFLAGIGTYVELYAELAVALNNLGYNVIAVDPPGHGYSSGTRGRYTLLQFQGHLIHVLDHLTERFTGRWIAYGYSIGAVSAVALAEKDDRISEVVCTTLLLSEVPPDLLYAVGWTWTRFSAMWFPHLQIPLKSFIDFETLLGDHPAGPFINKDDRMIFDYPLETLASLFSHKSGIVTQAYPFKLTVLQGDKDEVLTLEYTHRVIQAVEHPIELEVIEGYGHMLPWDDPVGLARRLDVCLRQPNPVNS